jgi:hypothetical protein
LNKELKEAIGHLLWVWYQYGEHHVKENGQICLEHMNMAAGEDAGDFLNNLGLGEDEGYCFVLNETGMGLMNLTGEGTKHQP